MNAREAVYEMWRERGMTTMFGNPGSTELPMLKEFPDDFRYVLALQEAVAVGMADGYAQASGTVGHVNLHTAPGVGNAMGGIFNAQANKTPLLVTAGQQARSLMTLQANLTNKDATRMPHPLVKWSFEPPRAEDVPHAIARATYMASLPPRGPAFVSIPFDDWDVDVDGDAVAHQMKRLVAGRQGPDPARVGDLVERLGKAKNPAMVAGPDIDMCGGWDAAVKFAEKQKLSVWATPAPGGGRLGFPENHPLFRGILPPAIGPAGETLKEYDLVLVVGSSVFPYYPNIPGPLLGENTELIQITNDPDEAARAPMGDAILSDPALALEVLNFKVEESDRDAPDPPWPAGDPEESDPISPSAVAAALAEVWPDDGILVLESPSSTLAMRNRLKLSKPGSYFFGAGGGLGFGLSAAVGVQLAQPDRQVVCVIGEGSVQYAVTAFWTAAAYEVPLKVLVLRNEEYAILKWFAEMEAVTGSPGLDLPALESAEVAKAYGVDSQRVDGRDALHQALTDALAADGPQLVEVKVAPGMALA
ncbi:MAG: benzoylformate decarboxylase [Thermoleophilaceae bacterium]